MDIYRFKLLSDSSNSSRTIRKNRKGNTLWIGYETVKNIFHALQNIQHNLKHEQEQSIPFSRGSHFGHFSIWFHI